MKRLVRYDLVKTCKIVIKFVIYANLYKRKTIAMGS